MNEMNIFLLATCYYSYGRHRNTGTLDVALRNSAGGSLPAGPRNWSVFDSVVLCSLWSLLAGFKLIPSKNMLVTSLVAWLTIKSLGVNLKPSGFYQSILNRASHQEYPFIFGPLSAFLVVSHPEPFLGAFCCFLCLLKTTVPLQILRYGRPNGRNYVQRIHKALRRLPVMVKVAAKFRVDKLIQVSKALLYLFQVNRLRISGQLVFTLSGLHGKPI